MPVWLARALFLVGALAVSLLIPGRPAAAPASPRLSVAVSLQQVTVTLQDGVGGYAGTADTYIAQYLPDSNLGTSGVLKVRRGTQSTLLRFDLSSLPEDIDVFSATVQLYAYSADGSGSVDVEVYRILRQWEEMQATWNAALEGQPWAEPGCAEPGTDRSAAPDTVSTLANTGRWYDVDVTAAVRDWVAGAANHGFLLTPSTLSSSNTFYFCASDYWDGTWRPKLIIVYTPVTATLTPSTTATSTQIPPTQTATLSPTPVTATLTPSATATRTQIPPTQTATLSPTPVAATLTPSATATGTQIPPTPTATPSPTPVDLRTPMPDSLYPYPEQRVGVVVFSTKGIDVSSLHTGLLKFEDRGPNQSERALGLDSLTVIQVGSGWCVPWDPIYGDDCRAQIAQLVEDNPGHLWFIGNEPENPCRPGWMSSSEYARMYHVVRGLIKDQDPTARVGIGGVVLPSKLRRDWLDNVLNAYQSEYDEAMPIDVWNVHNLLLSECPGPCRESDPNPCPSELRCSGGYVPRELWCRRGWYFSQAQQATVDIFKQLIVEFRTWMKERGYQNKPLIVTEMGVLAQTPEGSCEGCFSHVMINQFMYDAFDYMMNAADPQIGFAADGYRLVQRWTWYAVNPTLNFNGYLFERDGQLTDFGLNFANYAARFLPVSPVSIFFQRGWTGYRDDCDTWIGRQASGPGDYTLHIAADGSQRALLKFDVSVVPTDVQVVSATLSLRPAGRSGVEDMLVKCYGITRPWQVGEASWSNATQATPWAVAGCGGTADRMTEPVASVLVTDTDAVYVWDVTELAQEWVSDPTANQGVLLQGAGIGSGYWTFVSSDQPERPPYWYHRDRPKLEMVVRLPEPTPTPTHTPTATGVATATETATVTPTGTLTATQTLTPTVPGPAIYLPIVIRL